ncbi:MAG TPA: cupredoxin domain-containing protein [Candidatus Dormibacteraeota bacterium]|nr:cupredoxin domain-containing protein [Candidatus Dormibacteraeota bacterium]
METAVTARMTRTAPRREYGWFWLVQVAAVVETGLLVAAGAYLRDAEALTLAVVVLLTLGWILLRPGRAIPVAVRGLVFVDVAIWMVPAALSNALNHESLGSILLPGAMGTTAIVGLVATAGFLLSRGKMAAGRGVARGLAAAAFAVVLLIAGVAAVTGSGNNSARAGDLVIAATNARFSTTTLSGDQGTVTVDFTNNDLFWHTFTVPGLNVDIQAPVKGHRRVSFTAAPGSYEFFCAIPGHKQIGMRGTLVIQ